MAWDLKVGPEKQMAKSFREFLLPILCCLHSATWEPLLSPIIHASHCQFSAQPLEKVMLNSKANLSFFFFFLHLYDFYFLYLFSFHFAPALAEHFPSWDTICDKQHTQMQSAFFNTSVRVHKLNSATARTRPLGLSIYWQERTLKQQMQESITPSN